MARQMPHNLDAETMVLGSALINRQAAAYVADALEAEDFYHGGHRRAFKEIRSAVLFSRPVDAFTIAEALQRKPEGDDPHFSREEAFKLTDSLADAVPTAAHVEYYAGLVRSLGKRRRYIHELTAGLAEFYDADNDLPEAEDALIRRLLTLTHKGEHGPVRMSDALTAEVQRIYRGERVRACALGIPSVDRLTGGLERKEVAIIAGRPGAGKSILALQQLLYGAQHWGRMALVSLEMDEAPVVRRALSTRTGLSYRELRDAGYWNPGTDTVEPFGPEQLDAVTQAHGELLEVADRIWIDTEAFRLSKLIARLHRLKLQEGIEGAIVDYGQLIKNDLTRGNRGRVEELAETARALKQEVAGPLNIPVWCLVQPNRNVEHRSGGRMPAGENGANGSKPALLTMSDLGGSGEWENVANQILFINRDAEYGETETNLGILLGIGKSRNGPRGEPIPLVLHKATFTFAGRYGGDDE